MLIKNTILLGCFLLFVGCGDSSDPTLPDGGSQSDATNVDYGDCEYPAGPYGTDVGDIIKNISFKAFADQNFICKNPEDQVMDLSRTQTVSFQDLYCNKGCPENKRKLLWLMVSAGWCQPCQMEVAETQEQYEKGAIPPEVHIVNVLYQTDQGTPVTEDFAKLWAENSQFQLSFPVLLDPEYKMTAYFDQDAVPFNMLVDLSTMKVIFKITGANLPAVGQAMSDFLKNSK